MSTEIILTIMGKQHVIHETVINSFLIVIALSLFALFVNFKAKQVEATNKPSGFINVMEMLIEMINNLVVNTMGKKNLRFAPYITMLAFYLGVANTVGLLGLTPPTTDFNVTLALGLMTFVLVQGAAIKSKGVGNYLKTYIEPYPFLLPMNIIGEIANPISLAFRLFGNVLSGAIVMTLLYSMLGYFAPAITPVLHAYFDIIAGLLQTFIFMTLTMVYVSMAE